MKIVYIEKFVPNAYHGTTQKKAKEIVARGSFTVSRGENKFLGDGVYFYEASKWHAFKWAERHHPNINLGIIRAVINLGKCLDLHNHDYILLLKHLRRELRRRKIPEITDAVVINFYATQEAFDTVRATYTVPEPGIIPSKIFPESRYYEFTQLIICVRNQKRILGIEVIWEGRKYHA